MYTEENHLVGDALYGCGGRDAGRWRCGAIREARVVGGDIPTTVYLQPPYRRHAQRNVAGSALQVLPVLVSASATMCTDTL